MTQSPMEALWEKAQKLMEQDGQWRDFYVQRMGFRVVEYVGETKMRIALGDQQFLVNLSSGDWKDAPDSEDSAIHLLTKHHPRCHNLPKLALGEVCCFVGLDSDFLKISGKIEPISPCGLAQPGHPMILIFGGGRDPPSCRALEFFQKLLPLRRLLRHPCFLPQNCTL